VTTDSPNYCARFVQQKIKTSQQNFFLHKKDVQLIAVAVDDAGPGNQGRWKLLLH